MSARSGPWLLVDEAGLYCVPGDFHIDPHGAVSRAVVSHGHSDHARPGHGAVLATPETLAVMRVRLGERAGQSQPLRYGERMEVNGVGIRLVPAGHILGSAQIVLEWRGRRAVISGDYKRHRDPTCAPFETVACDIFVTEATFGLPVFRHEPAEKEIARLLASLDTFPERAHLVGAYGLGKAQRLIRHLREAGYDAPIWLHGALQALCDLYEELGVPLGQLRAATAARPADMQGAIVLAPPSALADRWSRRLPDPLTVFASGWMRVRGRARQRGVELPLVVSDHADWPELTRTVHETGAGEIWVTHGRDDALVHYLTACGLKARALALIGREDEDAET